MDGRNGFEESIQPSNLNNSEVLSRLRELLLGRLRGAFKSHPRVNEAFLEDVVQESLIRILDRLHQFEGRSKFLTWATTIALREAYGELRRKEWKDISLEQTLEASISTHGAIADKQPKPDEQWEQKVGIQLVEDLIANELTEKQQKALLAELKGMPLAEIAREMNSNRNAIYKLTHDARKRLKTKIEERGLSLEDIL